MTVCKLGITQTKEILLVALLVNLVKYSDSAGPEINSAACRQALGMESREIPDSALTASSSYDPEGVGPKSARIRSEIDGGAWCPQHAISRDSYEYLQIDLGVLKVISLVETQGRFASGQGQEFVDEYFLEYQREDGAKWFRFKNRWGQEMIQGNSNTYISEVRMIDPPIIAKKLRFVPFASRSKTVCLRVELYGCTWKDGLVSYSMPQGEPRGNEVTLLDVTYDGDTVGTKILGGLGQLVDGNVGDTNFRLENYRIKGYDWIGWKQETYNGPIVINFKFDAVRNFTDMIIHANNLIDKDIQVFRMAKIYFSIGGQLFLKEPIVFNYMRDTLITYARNVKIPLQNNIGKFVKVEMYFDSKWILVSEVTFNSEIAKGNHSVEVLPTSTPVPTTVLTTIPKSSKPNILQVDLISKNKSGIYEHPGDPSDLDPSQRSNGHVTYRPNYKSSGQKLGAFNLSRDDMSTTVGVLDSSKEKKESEPEYLGIIIGALSAVILLLFVIILIIIMRHRRNKYNSHRPMKVIDAPPRNVTLDLNDLQNTYNRKLLNGSVAYNHFSGSDGDSDRELLKNKNFDAPYGTPFDAIQRRRLPELPNASDLSETTTLTRDYAIPDVTTSVLLTEGNSPPPPYPGPVPSVYNSGSMKHPSAPPSAYNSLRQGPHYAASDVTNLTCIQGVSGNNVYAVPNPDMLWQEDNTVTEFPRENLQFIEKLGEGQFGEVHLCEAENITSYLGDDFNVTTKGSRSLLVAVKMLHKNAQQPARRDFHKEVQIMARLKDPNIVRVLGVCTREDPLCVIVEYMKYGDLNQFLQGHVLDASSTLQKKRLVEKNALSFGCLTFMAAQIAAGMRYLESLNMVHRDLATRNCLVGSQYVVKISDFGMSRGLYCTDYYRIEGRAVLPIRWMAWESILLGKFSTKTDVWSFGVTLWEILTLCREQPFENFTDEQVIENCGHYYRNDGLEMYLPCPAGCPREFYDLIRESWNRDDQQRPTFKEIQMFLQRKNMGYDPRSEHGYTSSPVLV